MYLHRQSSACNYGVTNSERGVHCRSDLCQINPTAALCSHQGNDHNDHGTPGMTIRTIVKTIITAIDQVVASAVYSAVSAAASPLL